MCLKVTVAGIDYLFGPSHGRSLLYPDTQEPVSVNGGDSSLLLAHTSDLSIH